MSLPVVTATTGVAVVQHEAGKAAIIQHFISEILTILSCCHLLVKKLSEIKKARAFTKIKMNVPVTKVAADLNISRQTVYTLLKATKGLPEGTVPKRKIWFW